MTLDPWSAQRSDWMNMMPEALRAEVEAFPKKSSEDRLRALIHKLCSWRDLPLVALGRIVGRNETYLRNRVVSPMAKAGELAFTIPEEPNHPRQTYRSLGLVADPK